MKDLTDMIDKIEQTATATRQLQRQINDNVKQLRRAEWDLGNLPTVGLQPNESARAYASRMSARKDLEEHLLHLVEEGDRLRSELHEAEQTFPELVKEWGSDYYKQALKIWSDQQKLRDKIEANNRKLKELGEPVYKAHNRSTLKAYTGCAPVIPVMKVRGEYEATLKAKLSAL